MVRGSGARDERVKQSQALCATGANGIGRGYTPHELNTYAFGSLRIVVATHARDAVIKISIPHLSNWGGFPA